MRAESYLWENNENQACCFSFQDFNISTQPGKFSGNLDLDAKNILSEIDFYLKNYDSSQFVPILNAMKSDIQGNLNAGRKIYYKKKINPNNREFLNDLIIKESKQKNAKKEKKDFFNQYEDSDRDKINQRLVKLNLIRKFDDSKDDINRRVPFS